MSEVLGFWCVCTCKRWTPRITSVDTRIRSKHLSSVSSAGACREEAPHPAPNHLSSDKVAPPFAATVLHLCCVYHSSF